MPVRGREDEDVDRGRLEKALALDPFRRPEDTAETARTAHRVIRELGVFLQTFPYRELDCEEFARKIRTRHARHHTRPDWEKPVAEAGGLSLSNLAWLAGAYAEVCGENSPEVRPAAPLSLDELTTLENRIKTCMREWYVPGTRCVAPATPPIV